MDEIKNKDVVQEIQEKEVQQETVENKPDFSKCFAYERHKMSNGKCVCSVLTEELCKTKGKCSFFKTVEQFVDDQIKARERNRKNRQEDMDYGYSY